MQKSLNYKEIYSEMEASKLTYKRIAKKPAIYIKSVNCEAICDRFDFYQSGCEIESVRFNGYYFILVRNSNGDQNLITLLFLRFRDTSISAPNTPNL